MKSRGFSLVELMVVMAMFGILVMGIVEITRMMQASQIQALSLAGKGDLSLMMKEALSRTDDCGFVSLAPPGISVTDTNWGSSTSYDIGSTGIASSYINVKKDDVYMNALQITSLKVNPHKDPVSNAQKYIALNGADENDLANATRIRADLEVGVKTKQSSLAVMPMIFPIELELDVAKTKIIGCKYVSESTLADMEVMCLSVGGSWNDLFQKCNIDADCPPETEMRDGTCTPIFDDGEEYVIHCGPNEACAVSADYMF